MHVRDERATTNHVYHDHCGLRCDGQMTDGNSIDLPPRFHSHSKLEESICWRNYLSGSRMV